VTNLIHDILKHQFAQMRLFPEVLGYSGGIILSVQMIPQILKIVKTKSTKDISTSFLILNISGLSLMTSYGIIRNDSPLYIPTSISLFMTIIVLILKIIYHKSQPNIDDTFT